MESTDNFKNIFYDNIINNNLESIQEAIKKGHVCTTDCEGNSALHIASSFGLLEIASLLIDGGTLIDSTNELGWTPLMIAARLGHFDMVSLLLSRGADRKKKNKYGLSALLLAYGKGHTQIVDLLNEGLEDISFELDFLGGIISPSVFLKLSGLIESHKDSSISSKEELNSEETNELCCIFRRAILNMDKCDVLEEDIDLESLAVLSIADHQRIGISRETAVVELLKDLANGRTYEQCYL